MVAGASASVLFYDQLVFHCMAVPIAMHFSADGRFGCFHVLATVNSAAVFIRVLVFVRTYVFIFLGISLRVELLGHV